MIFITLHNYSTLLSASIIPCIRSLWFICYLARPISRVTSILLYLFFYSLTFSDSMYNWYHIALVFWFILLTIIYSRSIHVVTTGRICSFLMTKLFVCIPHVFFPCICWWAFELFPFLANVNMHSHVCWSVIHRLCLWRDAIAATFSQSCLELMEKKEAADLPLKGIETL